MHAWLGVMHGGLEGLGRFDDVGVMVAARDAQHPPQHGAGYRQPTADQQENRCCKAHTGLLSPRWGIHSLFNGQSSYLTVACY